MMMDNLALQNGGSDMRQYAGYGPISASFNVQAFQLLDRGVIPCNTTRQV